MRPKSLILLALALGCGLIASIGISQVLDSKGRSAQVETVPIYVALKNINLGDPISDTLVSLEEWPKDRVPVGAIVKWEDLEDRRPRTTIFQGSPLLDTQLLAKGQVSDTLEAIPTNMRLKTVSVDARRSAAGLLVPGNRVDLQLFISRNEREGIYTPFTKVFLQNIRVFAVDQTVTREAEGDNARTIAKTVSLVVTPEQANKINLAENLGDVSLIPRNADDEAIIVDTEVSFEDLMGRAGGNSRNKEQTAVVEEAAAGLRGILETTPVEPAFSMTIIYPNEVSKFDFANGQPIIANNADSAVGIAPAALAPAAVAAPAEGEAEANFPIDLNIKSSVR